MDITVQHPRLSPTGNEPDVWYRCYSSDGVRFCCGSSISDNWEKNVKEQHHKVNMGISVFAWMPYNQKNCPQFIPVETIPIRQNITFTFNKSTNNSWGVECIPSLWGFTFVNKSDIEMNCTYYSESWKQVKLQPNERKDRIIPNPLSRFVITVNEKSIEITNGNEIILDKNNEIDVKPLQCAIEVSNFPLRLLNKSNQHIDIYSPSRFDELNADRYFVYTLWLNSRQDIQLSCENFRFNLPFYNNALVVILPSGYVVLDNQKNILKANVSIEALLSIKAFLLCCFSKQNRLPFLPPEIVHIITLLFICNWGIEE